jgi:threonine aldolase
MDIIDLRSDTVTQPTPAMRQAMASAEVGDDVYGEDPTVNRLEAAAAERLGKQAAMFVPSGTMGNLAAILTHCNRGEEIILGDQSHSFVYEAGGAAALGGVHPHPIANQPDGTLPLEAIEAAIRPDDPHFPVTRLICLENTHNRCGGVSLSPEYMRQVHALARRHGLRLHLDGARIFNAAVALGRPASELAEGADSVTFCLSKALCAPVGSLLCGDPEFIRHARRIRKQLGGGMRQAGILAAAGLVALEQMTERLAEDHARARALAHGLRDIPGLRVENDPPATNMVYLQLEQSAPFDAPGLAAQLAAQGVKVPPVGPRRMRLVTHYWIRDEHIERTVLAFRAVLQPA